MNKQNKKISDELLAGVSGGAAALNEEYYDENGKRWYKCRYCGFKSEDPGDSAMHAVFAHPEHAPQS